MTQQPSAHEGTVIITDKQTKGRGQRGNQWFTEPGKNLTFSLILKPSFLVPKDQFLITVIASLGVLDLIKSRIQHGASIKWPNDLIIGNKKVCGILIENQLRGNKIKYAVVGIGINVNQENFALPSATALSQVTGEQYDLPSLLVDLLECIEARYLMLRNGKAKELKESYINALFWRDELHTFSSQGEVFSGMIKGVDENGKLWVKEGETHRTFDIKEIEYLE